MKQTWEFIRLQARMTNSTGNHDGLESRMALFARCSPYDSRTGLGEQRQKCQGCQTATSILIVEKLTEISDRS